MELHIPIAAICGATTFLCKHGFLDSVKHTGDSLELFQEQKKYIGEAFYIHEQVVVDNQLLLQMKLLLFNLLMKSLKY
ncbi:DJ-1/PfpI family protein [Terrisporobacter mayombei]|uniref:DJ-1/PfpI family protein n=1 Tax=Terrisporobacter mayombei TaxID=1541 RepID=UPI0028165B2D|nr:DJ-1/PfpI family protein [Terrisporobacter mayombei]